MGESEAVALPSLRRGFLLVLLGNTVNAVAQWGIVVVLARAFDPTAVGQYALGLAISSPVTVLASLKLRSVVVTDTREEYCFGDYLGLRLVTTALALLAVGGIAGLSGLQNPALDVVLLVGVAKCLDAISDILQAGLQKRERMAHIAVGTALNGLLALFLVLLVSVRGHSVVWAAGAVAVSSGLVLFLYQIPVARRELGLPMEARLGIAQATGARMLALTVLSMPLGMNILFGALSANVPRYFIEHVLGAHQLGIFAAVTYFTAAGTIVINSAGQAVTPRLAALFAAGDVGGFRRLVAIVTAGGISLGLAGVALAWFAGSWLLGVVYGPEYMSYADVLVMVAGAAALTYAYIFLGTAATAMRMFRVQLPISLTTLLVTGTLCALLVPWLGLKGAALALVVAALGEAVLYLALVSRRLRRA